MKYFEIHEIQEKKKKYKNICNVIFIIIIYKDIKKNNSIRYTSTKICEKIIIIYTKHIKFKKQKLYEEIQQEYVNIRTLTNQ